MTTAPSDRLVSVMITVYNGESYLAEAIESVLTQTYRPLLELVVLDDGSTDGSGDVAKRFGSVRYERQENAGMGGARNSAIALRRASTSPSSMLTTAFGRRRSRTRWTSCRRIRRSTSSSAI